MLQEGKEEKMEKEYRVFAVNVLMIKHVNGSYGNR